MKRLLGLHLTVEQTSMMRHGSKRKNSILECLSFTL